MSKICKKRVHGNDKKNLPRDFKKCTGSLHFTLLSSEPKYHEHLGLKVNGPKTAPKTNGLKTNKPKTNIFHTSITSWKPTCYRLFGNFGNFFNDYFSQKYTAIENDSSIPPYKTFETEQNCLLLDSV